MLAAALTRLKTTSPARHYQMFDLYQLRGKRASEVAAFLGESENNVYVVRRRMLLKLRSLVLAIEADQTECNTMNETEFAQYCTTELQTVREASTCD